MSYRKVTEGKGKECFKQFFLDFRTLREISKSLYPQSTSKTIPLVSRSFNEFLTLGYLEEKTIKEPVKRGDQIYYRATKKFRGNLKPFIEYAGAEKKVFFEPLEERMLAELVDNPWFLSEYLSMNFRKYVVQGSDVVKGLKNLFRDSIIYYFFVEYAWSNLGLEAEELEVGYPKNDFYRLGSMLTFDRVLYTKIALIVFDSPLDSMINLYPRYHIIPAEKSGFLQIPEIYDVASKMQEEAKRRRKKELPEVYKKFKEEIQRLSPAKPA